MNTSLRETNLVLMMTDSTLTQWRFNAINWQSNEWRPLAYIRTPLIFCSIQHLLRRLPKLWLQDPTLPSPNSLVMSVHFLTHSLKLELLSYPMCSNYRFCMKIRCFRVFSERGQLRTGIRHFISGWDLLIGQKVHFWNWSEGKVRKTGKTWISEK